MNSGFLKAGPLPARSVGLATTSVALAIGLGFVLRNWFDVPSWFLFLVSCVGSAWIGGRLSGWVAVVISILACDFFFVRPLYSLAVASEQVPYIIVFALSMIAGNWFGSWRRQHEQLRLKERDALKVQAQVDSARLQTVEEALRGEVSIRKRAQLESQLAFLRWRAVFENASVGIVLLNEQALVIAVNPRYLSETQFSAGELLHRKFVDCIAQADRSRIEHHLDEILAGRHQSAQMELQHRRLDGTQIWLRTHLTPVPGSADFNRFLIAFCEDLTEQRSAEEALLLARSELAHASRLTLLGELTASIAHEVNQPLTAVVNNSSACLRWLAMAVPNLEEARLAAASIVRDATRAASVIARVRTMMRKSEPHWDLLDVNALVREGLDLIKGDLKRVAAEVQLELDPTLPMIYGDRVELQQVVLNLAINAIESLEGVSHRRAILSFTSARQIAEEAGIVLDVSDTGMGMKPSDVEHLFTPFFTTKAKGTGIGLWICRSIVERHSGQLFAHSNSPFGMTFRLLLPCKQPPRFSDAQAVGDDLGIVV